MSDKKFCLQALNLRVQKRLLSAFIKWKFKRIAQPLDAAKRSAQSRIPVPKAALVFQDRCRGRSAAPSRHHRSKTPKQPMTPSKPSEENLFTKLKSDLLHKAKARRNSLQPASRQPALKRRPSEEVAVVSSTSVLSFTKLGTATLAKLAPKPFASFSGSARPIVPVQFEGDKENIQDPFSY